MQIGCMIRIVKTNKLDGRSIAVSTHTPLTMQLAASMQAVPEVAWVVARSARQNEKAMCMWMLTCRPQQTLKLESSTTCTWNMFNQHQPSSTTKTHSTQQGIHKHILQNTASPNTTQPITNTLHKSEPHCEQHLHSSYTLRSHIDLIRHTWVFIKLIHISIDANILASISKSMSVWAVVWYIVCDWGLLQRCYSNQQNNTPPYHTTINTEIV